MLIDGKSVFYRGYYAMGALSLADGTPTGGIYGFASIATEIVKNLSPDKVVVAWDSKTSANKRKELYPDYKAGRVKPGDDFYAQIPLLQEMIKAFGWEFVECDNYEADDIIGTLAKQAAAQGTEVIIVSGDKDLTQLATDDVTVYITRKGITDIEKYTPAHIEEKYGLTPAQIIDMKGLMGDQSDNIPGVPGVGEKTAIKLLKEHGTVEGLYEVIDSLKASKMKEKLVEKLRGKELEDYLGKLFQ